MSVSTEPPATPSAAGVSAPPASTASSARGVSALRSCVRPWPCPVWRGDRRGHRARCLPAGCEAGSFGEGCRQHCDCEAGAPCDPVTGQCLCPPGRTGATCDRGKSGVPLGGAQVWVSAFGECCWCRWSLSCAPPWAHLPPLWGAAAGGGAQHEAPAQGRQGPTLCSLARAGARLGGLETCLIRQPARTEEGPHT